jgi:hypothetical protein
MSLSFYDAHETEICMQTPEDSLPKLTTSGSKVISKLDPDYDQLPPFFGRLAQTFEHTMKYARLPTGNLLEKSYKVT